MGSLSPPPAGGTLGAAGPAAAPLDPAALSQFELLRPPVPPILDPSTTVSVRARDINTDFRCPVCLGVLNNTTVTKECLHRFCRDCIVSSLRFGKKECPTCRTKCASKRSLRPDTRFDSLISTLYPHLEAYIEKQDSAADALVHSSHQSSSDPSPNGRTKKQDSRGNVAASTHAAALASGLRSASVPTSSHDRLSHAPLHAPAQRSNDGTSRSNRHMTSSDHGILSRDMLREIMQQWSDDDAESVASFFDDSVSAGTARDTEEAPLPETRSKSKSKSKSRSKSKGKSKARDSRVSISNRNLTPKSSSKSGSKSAHQKPMVSNILVSMAADQIGVQTRIRKKRKFEQDLSGVDVTVYASPIGTGIASDDGEPDTPIVMVVPRLTRIDELPAKIKSARRAMSPTRRKPTRNSRMAFYIAPPHIQSHFISTSTDTDTASAGAGAASDTTQTSRPRRAAKTIASMLDQTDHEIAGNLLKCIQEKDVDWTKNLTSVA